MEQDRFDALAVSLADEGTSRRSVLGRLATGGVAAALGITAFAGFEDDEAEAKKKCKKRCKKKNTSKKRRKCRKRCKRKTTTTTSTTPAPPAAGFPITINTTLLGTPCTALGGECGTGTGLECVGVVCLPIDLGNVCVTGATCDTGQCTGGFCTECGVLNLCGTVGSQQCCVANATCVAGLCVLPS